MSTRAAGFKSDLGFKHTVEPPASDHSKCQALVVAYGRWSPTRALTILGQNFASLAYGNCRDLPHVHVKSQFLAKKIRYFPLRNFPSLVLSRNVIMLQLIVQFLLYYLSNGRLREVKNRRKFQTFSSKSGRGRLREVAAYKRFQI